VHWRVVPLIPVVPDPKTEAAASSAVSASKADGFM